ncbi:MAG: TVP38/TMEM64 family protein [Treponemataceae bacterium]
MSEEIQDEEITAVYEKPEKKDIILNHVITFLGIVGIVATIVLFYLAYKTGLLTDEAKMVDFLRKTEPFTPIVFFIIQFFQTVIPIMPGAITIPAGDILFGHLWGFVINYVSIIIGSITAFWLCRVYGRRLLWVLVGDKAYKRYIRLLDKPTFTRIFVVGMFVPFMPADIFCMVAGVSNMKSKFFTIVLLLGKPVSLLFYTGASVYVIKWLCTLF